MIRCKFPITAAAILMAGTVLNPVPGQAALSIFWDFYDGAGDPNGWTVVAGMANYRSGDGGGVGPANADNTDYAHDGAHPNFIFRSPVLDFSAASNSGPVLSWGTSGGAGDQEANGPDYASPADVLAFNGGNSAANGEKGLAFFNVSTGLYDAVFFNLGNGGTDTNDYTLTDLTVAGVNPAQNYHLDFYETDEAGWGWGQTNFVNVDASVVPEPSATLLVAMGLALVLVQRRAAPRSRR